MYDGTVGHVGKQPKTPPIKFKTEFNTTATELAKVDVPIGRPNEKTVDAGANDLYANYVRGGLNTGETRLTLGRNLLTPDNQLAIDGYLKQYVPTQEMALRIGEHAGYQFDRITQ